MIPRSSSLFIATTFSPLLIPRQHSTNYVYVKLFKISSTTLSTFLVIQSLLIFMQLQSQSPYGREKNIELGSSKIFARTATLAFPGAPPSTNSTHSVTHFGSLSGQIFETIDNPRISNHFELAIPVLMMSPYSRLDLKGG